MGKMSIEIKSRELNNIQAVAGFEGQVSNIEENSWDLGQMFHVPPYGELQRFSQPIGRGLAKYILVDEVDAYGRPVMLDGEKCVKRLYLGTLNKRANAVNADLTPVEGGRHKAGGSVCKAYQQSGSMGIEEGLKAIAGRFVKVTKVDLVTIKAFGRMDTTTTTVVQMDDFTPEAAPAAATDAAAQPVS